MVNKNDKLMKKQSQRSSKKIDSKDNLCTNNKVNPKAEYFVWGPNIETEKTTSTKTILTIHNESSNMFTDIESTKGTFSLKVKDEAKSYKSPPRYETYALQEPFKKS